MELTLEEEVTSIYVEQINGESFEFEKLLIEEFSNGATQQSNEMWICVAPKKIHASYLGLYCTNSISAGEKGYSKVILERVSGIWQVSGYSSRLLNWSSNVSSIREHRDVVTNSFANIDTITSFTIIPYAGTISPGVSFKIYGKPAKKGATT